MKSRRRMVFPTGSGPRQRWHEITLITAGTCDRLKGQFALQKF
jgi:hypothetical protein